jgi:phosphonate transport system substrate-binding protein
MKPVLRLTTCQAPIADAFVQVVTEYLAQQLNLPIEFVNDLPWPERLRQFDTGEIQICWLCGVSYVWRADQPTPSLELLAAPVPAPARYQNRPIYFSDVVVHAASPFHTFADLRHARWAINERTSHSGYFVTRYYLAQYAQKENCFRAVLESGAHQTSVQMILEGQIEAAAIDSTVLELMVEHQPALKSQLRVITVFGPSPIPPWVIKTNVNSELRAAIRQALSQMHATAMGRAGLAVGQVARFAGVSDSDYDPIRHMLVVGQQVPL